MFIPRVPIEFPIWNRMARGSNGWNGAGLFATGLLTGHCHPASRIHDQPGRRGTGGPARGFRDGQPDERPGLPDQTNSRRLAWGCFGNLLDPRNSERSIHACLSDLDLCCSHCFLPAFACPFKVALGVKEFSQMFVVALTIFAGILIGSTIVRPETTL